MSEIHVETNNSADITDNINVTEEKTTLIDSLLNDSSFTSIESLKDIDNDDTIINSSYITDVNGKKTTFLDVLKQTDSRTLSDDSIVTTGHISKESSNSSTYHRVASIDDPDLEFVDDLVNNKFLKKIKSNDSLELKYKSITKLENVENLNVDDENENESETLSSSNLALDNNVNKTNLDDFPSKESLNSLPVITTLKNNDGISNSNNTTLSASLISTAVYTPPIKNSTGSFSVITENEVCNESINSDIIFNNKGNFNVSSSSIIAGKKNM